jgi:hypothetical protein
VFYQPNDNKHEAISLLFKTGLTFGVSVLPFNSEELEMSSSIILKQI